MKKSKLGLGKLIYMEWLFPVKDYFFSLRRNEAAFELLIPACAATFCTIVYYSKGKVISAFVGLADLLPTAISILIGFTVMLITLLLTSSGKNVEALKEKTLDKELYQKKINLFQGLHIQFSHSLFSEVILLLIVLAFLFWNGVGIPSVAANIFLWIEIYLTLNILLSILRGITSVYFSFYKT
jgi:hypothetical protein